MRDINAALGESIDIAILDAERFPRNKSDPIGAAISRAANPVDGKIPKDNVIRNIGSYDNSIRSLHQYRSHLTTAAIDGNRLGDGD
jgi:hypothetical protein